MKQISSLIEEYVKLFGGYPYFYMCGQSKDKQRMLLEKAIKNSVPITLNYKKGMLY